MKPILIFRHIACEGPGYLGDYLNSRNIPFHIVCIDQGEDVPKNFLNYSGFVFMGGPMSVNDSLPWIEQELELIRAAHQADIPVLGHCLGGQLISKALGGEVRENPVTEMGWHPITPYNNEITRECFPELPKYCEVFHWHGETFSLPEGATPLFKSEYCKQQAFSLGKCLALQFHVEMKDEMVSEWYELYKEDIPEACASVQTREQMLENIEAKIEHSKIIAETIYNKWLEGLAD